MYYLIPPNDSLNLFRYSKLEDNVLYTTARHTLTVALTSEMRYHVSSLPEIQKLIDSAVISSPDPITPDSHPELFI
jgi:hypothetical protein